jgi:hypothetical protein
LTISLVVACGNAKQAPPASGSGSANGGSDAGIADAPGSIDAPVNVPDAAVSAADAGVAEVEVPCTVKDIKQARKDADTFIKAGKARDAVALLQRIQCWLDEGQDPALQEQIAWQISDLALALYKAGDPEACYARAAGQLDPYPHNVASSFGEDSAVIRALGYNAELCHKAGEKKRGPFVDAGECSGGDGVAVPPGILAGAPACIVIGEPRKDADGNPMCGSVTLVQGKKRTRLAIASEDANLADPSVCCNISSFGFAKRKQGWAMLVKSGGRNCQGGTANTSEEHVYELSGATLTLAHQLDYASH